jgi:hypothetical protein|tara:strand:- start:1173 stop:2159 length:987 start_codon:yes stop_codon:yes gene_type:complete
MYEQIDLFIKDSKPIYITGNSGSGKTYLIDSYFKNINMNIKKITLKKIINISYLDEITKLDIIDVFNNIKREIIIIIDDIDVLNIQEKKIINELIKMLKNINKYKKKLKYKLIFSGINYSDKKIKELMRLSNIISLGNNIYNKNIYINIENILNKNNKVNTFEFDKSIQSLLLHENIINNLTKNNINFYYNFLINFCNGDYYDRISFQKQIWLYNDITFYIKFIINILLYNKENITIEKNDIRFTKILTKYSNEYNNNNFINNICNKLYLTNKELYNLCINNNLYIKSIQETNEKELHNLPIKLSQKDLYLNKLSQKDLVRLYKIYNI